MSGRSTKMQLRTSPVSICYSFFDSSDSRVQAEVVCNDVLMNENAIAGKIGRMLRVISVTSKCPVIQINSLCGAQLSRKLRA
jgi:hypothetical protein